MMVVKVIREASEILDKSPPLQKELNSMTDTVKEFMFWAEMQVSLEPGAWNKMKNEKPICNFIKKRFFQYLYNFFQGQEVEDDGSDGVRKRFTSSILFENLIKFNRSKKTVEVFVWFLVISPKYKKNCTITRESSHLIFSVVGKGKALCCIFICLKF